MWAIFLLSSVSYLFYSLYEKTREYYTYPIVTYTSSQTLETLPFPAVTICNSNRKNYSKMHKDDRLNNFWMSVGRVPFLAKDINWSDPFYEERGFFEPQSVENITEETMDLKNFIILSSFDDKYRLKFDPLITEEGFCYTFNNDGETTTSNFGALNNLLLMIDINQEHYGPGQDLTAGIKVVLHDADEIPDIYNEGFYVGPGVSALASVRVSKYTYLGNPFKAFGERKCHKVGVDKNPLHPLTYSVTACQKLCKAKETFKACHCINVDDLGILVVAFFFLLLPELNVHSCDLWCVCDR
ncbi:hypothetical protein FSP39_005539 [Pinctada imbricata]|uniref:Uncharacterized protein n=1 Tax=Pinctada imbricata TaxID=66713 RepID=A0AA88YDQ6_PINIB|nr:hypothetical protein FSP39_005539 [Pinctada imbricata]